jgi:hypothetical protein
VARALAWRILNSARQALSHIIARFALVKKVYARAQRPRAMIVVMAMRDSRDDLEIV